MAKERILTFAVLFVLSTVGMTVLAQANDVHADPVTLEHVNLIVNSSFEDGLNGWRLNFPGEGKFVDIETNQGVDGIHSLRLAKVVEGSIGVSQTIYPIPGQTYRIRGAVRSQDLVLAERPQPNGILVRLQYLDENGENLQRHTEIFLEDTGGEWVRFDTLVTIHEDAARVWFELLLYRATGMIWWDDISMVLEPAEAQATGSVSDLPAGFESNMLSNGGFEDDLTGWKLNWPGEGKSVDIDTDDVVEGEKSLRLSKEAGVEGSIGVRQDIAVVAGRQYRVRAAVRSGELVHEATRSGSLLRLQYVDKTGQNLQRHTNIFIEDTRGEWVFVDEVITVPDEAVTAWFELLLLRATGTIWWDAVSIVPHEEAPTMDSSVTSSLDIIPRVAPQVSPGEHPRLYVTQAEIEALKQFARQNPAVTSIIDQAITRPARRVVWDYEDVEIVFPPKPPTDQGEEVSRAADPIHQRFAKDASTAALGYAYTGNPDMGEVAKRILLTYAEQYMNFPQRTTSDGRMTSQTREEALWLIEMAWAYDLLLGGDLLTEEDKANIETMLREAVRVIDRNRMALSTLPWQAGHIAAVMAAGVVLEDESIIASALVGPKSFTDLIGPSFYLDGLAQSTSISHHQFVMERWLLVAEAAYRSGYDVYAYTFNGLTLKDIIDIAFHYVFSHGEHPVVGHSSYGLRLSFHWTLAFAYERYKDPKYLWLWQKDGVRNLLNLPESRRVVFYLPGLLTAPAAGDVIQAISFGPVARGGRHIAGSTLLEDSGFAFLRGKAYDGTQLETVMLFKPHGTRNSHQSYDNLTFQLSGRDSVWIPGTGGPGYAYDRPEQQGWYEQSVARSGVVVDESTQYPYSAVGTRYSTDRAGRTSAGQLLSFVALPSVALADAMTANVYDGVTMNRTLLLSAPYLLDRYTVHSDTEHLYDWVVHVRGQEGAADVELTPRPGPLADKPGYKYMNDVRTGSSAETWSAVWSKPNEHMRLIMLGEDGTEIVRAVGIGRSVNDPQPLAMARRRTDSTQFVALYELYKNNPVIVDLQRIATDVYEGVKVVRSDGSHDLWVWQQEAAESTDRIEVDDTAAFVGREAYFRAPDANSVRSAAVVRGLQLELQDLAIRLSKRTDLAVEAAGTEYISLIQTGQPVVSISITLPNDVGDHRLFRLGARADGTVVAEEIPGISRQESGTGVTLRLEAEQYEVYLLSVSEPEQNWLERYSIRYSL